MPGITRTILLYRSVQLLSLPVIAFYFFARLLKSRDYRRHFRERLGFLPRSFSRTGAGAIWLHAVSAGEVASAVSLLKSLRAAQPRIPLYLSTSTAAGRRAAERQALPLVDGLFYAPLDYVSCIRRTLRAIRPNLLIIFETEIWPNLYNETRRLGGRLVIVNGRISSRAWPRYRRLRSLFQPLMRIPDLVFAQSITDRNRYEQLGVPARKLVLAGNLKYDVAVPAITVQLPHFEAEHVWIAASTAGPNERGSAVKHAVDEDDIAIGAFQTLAREFPSLLLILAPRQPARFDQVARKLSASGASFVRRSQLKTDMRLPLPGVLLLDSIGELASLYSRAQVVFVGGSLAPRGGHNIIEPAAAGAAVIVGPHMQNFEAIADDFLRANAIVQIQSAVELTPTLRDLLADKDRAKELGLRARQVVAALRGASRTISDRLWPLYYSADPRPPRSIAIRLVLRPLTWLWREGGALKRRTSEHRAASLLPIPASVVSVGGITVGGSGKTPFTTYLAEKLKERGHSPAILTRGYRRRSPAEYLVFAPGAKVPTAFTGDEPQIFLRAGVGPLGIGANRYQTALILLRQFPSTDVLLLDDGFQHAQLERDFDIVLIDGLDPFGQNELVPLGRLREPLDALSRADAFVITRAEIDPRYAAICDCLRQYNQRAPIFRTRLVARCWRDYRTGACIPDIGSRRVAAFCALGNPDSFWRTLNRLGLQVVFRWSFPDHHPYKPVELQRIAHQARFHGAELLVTTEKDRINCPSDLGKVIAPLDLAWLEIQLEIEDEPAFFAELEKAIHKRETTAVS
ncbi:MAG TPA: tetraacyldisaccharide 4'-kinase [Bryobacteraceae bacterium]|nr:tetraacyldisaccharide 4'-kinase [Bryobacteraceae bacterium]